MNKRLLRFNDFVGMSHIDEAILYKPGVSYWWKGKPMEKFENVFLHMEDAYRSSAVKFRTLSSLGVKGDYEFVFKRDNPQFNADRKEQTGQSFRAAPGQGVASKPGIRVVSGTEYVEGTYECYARFDLSQNGQTGQDTSTVTLFDAYGNFYMARVGEAAQYDKSNLLRNLTVSDKNIIQTGKYKVLIKGSVVTLDFVVNKEYLRGVGGLAFNYNPKMESGWNKPACYWIDANPFLDTRYYKTEKSKMDASNKFRKFVNDHFPQIAKEKDLSASRNDSSAYCSKNIKETWNYITEGGYTLGQFFPYIDDPDFIASIKSDIGAVDKYFNEIAGDQENLAKEKSDQLGIPDKIYNLPGDKSWDYKIRDGVWFAAKKGWKSDSDWSSLAGNKAAQSTLNKKFPKAGITDLA